VADSACASLREAADLAGLGLAADAAQLLARWAAGDERLAAGGRQAMPLEWLFAAIQAYGIGRVGLGISLAERARESGAGLEPSTQWGIVPWAFPPAFESLFVEPRDTVVAALEPALLFALTRQESVFDPRARSRSDALGLMQLKLPTAADMARLAHDPAPAETTLFDPERNVRYGARYLARLLRRFDGSVAAALEAYNAGAGSLSPRWRELRARGGEALVCELAANPLAQDYAKRILGFRQGYRELRPTAADR
jgi:soluble lytic murein transglycosylase